ncbi:hypothetical protein D3272_26120 [Lichenibacterium ramalinae]|uniref:Uncharacterized protein n=1 Tax=Lichenibacterium ramalinae TaxID=2316527 RepID=A0A4Q2R6Z2_9HYPH|nr:hypothetical protein D3272_26120 [Lichenibacterium ramalinae]
MDATYPDFLSLLAESRRIVEESRRNRSKARTVRSEIRQVITRVHWERATSLAISSQRPYDDPSGR